MGGVDLSGGEYTLLAPANSAFDKHNAEVGTPIDAAVLKYHVIEGKKTMDALNTDQKTLNGGTLTAYRKFRKNWLDGAIIGLKSEGPSKSSNWPSDVACDNGSSRRSTRCSYPVPMRVRGKRELAQRMSDRWLAIRFDLSQGLHLHALFLRTHVLLCSCHVALPM